MPRRRRTTLGMHTPVQRRCWLMRANVPPLDQADVTALQPFIGDAYAKIASERLQFLRREQDHLRADSCKDLRETIVNQDEDPRNVGQKVILLHFAEAHATCLKGNKLPWPALENLADQI